MGDSLSVVSLNALVAEILRCPIVLPPIGVRLPRRKQILVEFRIKHLRFVDAGEQSLPVFVVVAKTWRRSEWLLRELVWKQRWLWS